MKRLPLIACCLTFVCGNAIAQPVPAGTIQISVSTTDKCVDALFGDQPYKIYITNTDPNNRISANVKYDTTPAGSSFALYDNQFNPISENYPIYYEQRLAPGEQRAIGCTSLIRAGGSQNQKMRVPIAATLAGAVYVDPSSPAPPPEDPSLFIRFFAESVPGGCQGSPSVVVWATSIHTYRVISATFTLANNTNNFISKAKSFSPFQSAAVGCGFGPPDQIKVTGLSSAKFTTGNHPNAKPPQASANSEKNEKLNRP